MDDNSLKKVILDQKLRDGKISPELYEKKMYELGLKASSSVQSSIKEKKIFKANLRDLLIILAIIIIVIFINTKVYKSFFKEYIEVDDLYNLETPVQTPCGGGQIIEAGKEKIHLVYVAKYKIQGRVISRRRYWGLVGAADRKLEEQFCPLDLGIVWGKYATDEMVEKYEAEANYRYMRTIAFDYDSSGTHITGSGGHSSNNHLIPANNKIKQKLTKISKGDFIQLEGYLVNAFYNVEGKPQSWYTSQSRYDTYNDDPGGKITCETIYVEDVKWLKQK